jgi:Papain fold toxin 1, glutamine deamidase
MPGLDEPRVRTASALDGPTAQDHRPAGRALGHPGVLERSDRLEHAAAYRAAVDEAYGNRPGRAAAGRQRESADSACQPPDMAGRYPADYVRPAHGPPRVDRPHESPRPWLRDVNEDEARPGRDNNCGECARVVHSTWHGRPAAAAALADPDSKGEPAGRMAEWAGLRPVPASMAEIGSRLKELGPGSSAVVGCDWKGGGGGHWFNAVNDAGSVLAVDGQRNRVGPWPPTVRDLRFDEGRMELSDAIFFGPDGKVVRS